MWTRRTPIVASLIAAFAFVAAGSLAATAAPAEAYYLNTSTDADPDNAHLNLFRFPPANPGFKPCIRRTVRMRPGPYVHGAYVVHLRHRKDADLEQVPIRISVRGKYRWQACRRWDSDGDYYVVTSRLRGHGFSHTNVNVIEPDVPLGAPSHVTYGNGYYEWGGRIARDCPGCTSPSR